jgi:hypothetical protein
VAYIKTLFAIYDWIRNHNRLPKTASGSDFILHELELKDQSKAYARSQRIQENIQESILPSSLRLRRRALLSMAMELESYPMSEVEQEPLLPDTQKEQDPPPIKLLNIETPALPPRSRVLQFTRNPAFSVYRRIFLSIFLINIYHAHHIITMRRRSKYSPLLVDLSTAASANMLVAILVRQDYILNTLFRLCWLIPFVTPLRIRRSIAKIYEYGGLHSGAAVCSVLYFSLLSAILTREYMTFRIADPLIMISTFTIVAILWCMLIAAYPTIRSKRHNIFEATHRFGGWIVLGTFFPQLWLFTRALGHQAGPDSPGAVLTKLPAFWLLLITAFHVALPWMRLRRILIRPERLGVGVHAIRLHLDERIKNCVVYRIADKPFTEWHSFACIPEPKDSGGSLIISNSGDWTRRAINNPKKYYYTKGIPTVGVLCMAKVFRNVIIVTTGSGIGPCLGTMMDIPAIKCRILWSAPSPRQTFGEEIYRRVLEVDSKAVIIDTYAGGRRDVVVLAYHMYMTEKAEAVFCISNKSLTKKLVYEMESRGVPAFGPIWDS